jgi:predicted ATPase
MIRIARIRHYKSIEQASLTLGPINIIVGPNGSGKSNILDAIYFLHDCVSHDIDTAVTRRHGIDSLRQWSKTRPYDITLDLEFENEGGFGAYKVVISSNRGNFRIKEEAGRWTGPVPAIIRNSTSASRTQSASPVTASFNRNETGQLSQFNSNPELAEKIQPERFRRVSADELCLQFAGSRIATLSMVYFRPIFQELSSFAKYSIFPNTLRIPQLISKEATLEEDGSNLSSILKKINSDKRYSENKENIIDSVKSLLSGIVDIQIKGAGGFYVPVMRVSEAGGEVHDFNLSQISDGTLRTLGLLAAFYQPSAPTKIGIEEPELMIHPGALQIMKEAMETYTSSGRRGGQIIVTTHSPPLIDLFAPERVIWTRIKNGITRCGPIGRRQLDIVKQQLFSVGELMLAEELQ